MRAKTRREMASLIYEQVAAIVDHRLGNVRTDLLACCDQITSAVAKIQPASVDLTQEMADDIVRKIHGPLTISKDFSRWVADQGKFHDCFYTFQVGYGSDAGRGEMRLKGDGTMHLELRDLNGAHLWRGTFVPPDFGKAV